MTFDSEKEIFLKKVDKSAKGDIDASISELCKKLNSKDNYYTTSSCSGRIVLLQLATSQLKKNSKWLYVSHDEVQQKDLQNKLIDLPQEEVWFKYEPFILHVASRTTQDAREFLTRVRDLGFKRSGIISIGSKIMVEVIGTERIETIISKENQLLVSPTYINLLVDSSNIKLRKNLDQIKQITEQIKAL